nr:nucleoside triphosphate pyrophosphohydrolase family protein [Alteromonas macleodii]|tara:strand:- start:12467 stop:13075 length:609 start_codon:yes stop_codon:yes gene_type:complete
MLLDGIKYNFLTPEIFKKFFSDITDFRTAFDLPIGVPYSAQDYQLHFDLYREEMQELFSAETRVDKIDAIVDSLYVLFGKYVQFDIVLDEQEPCELNIIETLLSASEELNFDILKAWDIVHHSNMSKLCNDDNVQATLDHYTALGVSVEAKPVTLTNKNKNEGTALWAVKVKEESTDLDGKSYAAGKVLKSVDYTPADLSKL